MGHDDEKAGVSTPGMSGRGRKFEPGKFSSFSHPWNNFGKFYGIKSPEYFYGCNFIPSTLRSIDRNSAKKLGQCGIEPRTVVTFALEVRLSNHFDTSHLIHTRLVLIPTQLELIHTWLNLIH
jgi:hypothetical protein